MHVSRVVGWFMCVSSVCTSPVWLAGVCVNVSRVVVWCVCARFPCGWPVCVCARFPCDWSGVFVCTSPVWLAGLCVSSVCMSSVWLAGVCVHVSCVVVRCVYACLPCGCLMCVHVSSVFGRCVCPMCASLPCVWPVCVSNVCKSPVCLAGVCVQCVQVSRVFGRCVCPMCASLPCVWPVCVSNVCKFPVCVSSVCKFPVWLVGVCARLPCGWPVCVSNVCTFPVCVSNVSKFPVWLAGVCAIRYVCLCSRVQVSRVVGRCVCYPLRMSLFSCPSFPCGWSVCVLSATYVSVLVSKFPVWLAGVCAIRYVCLCSRVQVSLVVGRCVCYPLRMSLFSCPSFPCGWPVCVLSATYVSVLVSKSPLWLAGVCAIRYVCLCSHVQVSRVVGRCVCYPLHMSLFLCPSLPCGWPVCVLSATYISVLVSKFPVWLAGVCAIRYVCLCSRVQVSRVVSRCVCYPLRMSLFSCPWLYVACGNVLQLVKEQKGRLSELSRAKQEVVSQYRVSYPSSMTRTSRVLRLPLLPPPSSITELPHLLHICQVLFCVLVAVKPTVGLFFGWCHLLINSHYDYLRARVSQGECPCTPSNTYVCCWGTGSMLLFPQQNFTDMWHSRCLHLYCNC